MKKLLLVMFLFLMCGCGSKNKVLFENKEELDIVVVSDLHFYDKSLFQDCSWFGDAWLYEDGQMIHYTHDFVKKFVDEMIRQQPNLILISGDLTYNGEKVSHEALAELLKQLENNDIEVAIINGNHDVNSMFAYGYNEEGAYDIEGITFDEFKKIYQDFGYNQSFSQDKHSLSYALHLNNNYDLVVVDSCKSESYSTASAIKEETMTWLEDTLKEIETQNKKTLVMMHHNVFIHCESIYQGYVLENADAMKSLLNQYNVPLVLSGHSHIQHTMNNDHLSEIVSSAFSIAPIQYGQLTLSENTITYETKKLSNVEGDEDFFLMSSYLKFYDNLEKKFDQETAKKLAKSFSELNLYYFSGTVSDYVEKYKEELSLLKDADFHTSYIQAMLSEKQNHNQLKIQLKDE